MKLPLNPEYPYHDLFVSYAHLNNHKNIKEQAKIAFNSKGSLMGWQTVISVTPAEAGVQVLCWIPPA